MSTQKPNQPTLEDYLVDQHAQDGADGDAERGDVMEGARYGLPGERRNTREPADAGLCKNCGKDLRADPDISDDVLRVLADNHDRTPVCDRLDCRREVLGEKEKADKDNVFAKAVKRARSEVSVRP